MASAGIRKNRNGTRYQVWWRLDDGSQGSKTFDSRTLARDFKNELLAQAAANAWVDPRRGRLLFDDWADHWWRLWSASPRRSPKGMETTDSRLRCHLRPSFGRRQLRQITPSIVLRWQHDLEANLSHSGVMACRSILGPILEAARKEHLLATNPGPRGGGSQAAPRPRPGLRPPAPTDLYARGGRAPPGRLSAVLSRPLPQLPTWPATTPRRAASSSRVRWASGESPPVARSPSSSPSTIPSWSAAWSWPRPPAGCPPMAGRCNAGC